YRDMGVVISPSHFETYGNVAKESIATGTPAMISSNMGVSETFKNLGLHNWIIDFNSVEDVYKKIENVMGENVHVSVKDKMKKLYSPCKIFNQIISVLTTAA
ncbi:MAG: glycosyltransferase, partial [Candidatus Pacebacteria bacterium]|nr:glycosyltransferase [Candidatus Paceibacterota bacterium]